ncbi:MAG: gliding motility protein GldN [Prevotella sp.]|jgi:gliding motility associated protien GldN|nr:gliding motility protein GldN [Prevotella sp.]
MKQLFLFITIALSGFLLAQPLCAQQEETAQSGSIRDRIAKRENQQQQKQESLPQLSVRAENMNKQQTQWVGNAPWVREIYRFLDLNDEKNAPLYYPVTPIGTRMNLFTMIFKLLANNEISAYEFQLDRIETFTSDNKLKFKDLLDRFSVMYTEQDGKFVVEDVDIPGNEVLGYYVKEAYYFDKANSVVDTKILAVCPIIFTQGDFEAETTRYPLFWLPYEEIRPYAARMPIMLSNLNNASTQTIDDFFRKREFKGEIYKTTNMKNLSLSQMYANNDSLVKKEQKKIETQLKDFKDKLWAMSETETPANAKAKKDEKKEKAAVQEKNTETKTRTNEVKQSSSASSSSAASAPVRSMRGRDRR